MSIKIRALKRKDRKTLGNLLVKFVQKTDGNKQTLLNMIPPTPSEDSTESNPVNEKDKNTQIIEFAFSLIQGFIQFVEEDVSIWFMDLAGIESIEDYDNLEFDAETDIINQLLEAKGFISFFSKGSQAFNKIKHLVNRSEN